MKRVIVISWLVLLHLVAGYLIYQRIEMSMGSNQVTSKPPSHYRYLTRAHVTVDPFVADGAVIFIGDSITEGLNTSAISSNSVNYGISNDTTSGVLQRLKLYESLRRAALVVVAVGVNDLVFRSVDDTVDNYARILEEIPADTPILMSALLPVDENAGWEGLNAKIGEFNRRLPELAGKRNNATLLDIGARFADGQGNLSKLLHIDGVHLNQAGYRLWIETLRAAISEMQVTH